MKNLQQQEIADDDDEDGDDDDDDDDDEEDNDDNYTTEDDYETGDDSEADGLNYQVHPISAVERRRSFSIDEMSNAAVTSASRKASTTSMLTGYDGGDDDDREDDVYPTLEMLTHPASLSHLIVMLHDAGLASVAERAVLLKLAKESDSRLLAAFDVYHDMLVAVDAKPGQYEGEKMER